MECALLGEAAPLLGAGWEREQGSLPVGGKVHLVKMQTPENNEAHRCETHLSVSVRKSTAVLFSEFTEQIQENDSKSCLLLLTISLLTTSYSVTTEEVPLFLQPDVKVI